MPPTARTENRTRDGHVLVWEQADIASDGEPPNKR